VGKIAAEHGIGLLRKPFLSMNLDPCQIELLKGLKKTFDPKNILNPGKIFDLQEPSSAPLPSGKV
jgi:glycolate oxidase